MSNIYIQEPPASGKILLETTVGDIDIEIWAKEVPIACRNFVQLCMEGYYNGTIFHRVIKGFMVQGGDPTGTGYGGSSIYDKPFKDEFHSRLRFVRRGLVAMASSGKDSNESQFFFTLGASLELQNKHTIFGKVAGNTIYNMIKLEDGLVGSDDRPLYPHKIISTKVLKNPFDDIIPRILKPKDVDSNSEKKKKTKGTKNFKLLSFGDEAEEEEIEADEVSKEFRSKGKSSHDLTDDPKLSTVTAVDLTELSSSSETKESAELDRIRKRFNKKETNEDVILLEPSVPEPKKTQSDEESESEEEEVYLTKSERSEKKLIEIKKEIKSLKKEFRDKARQQKEMEIVQEEAEEPKKEPDNVLLAEFHKEGEVFKEKQKDFKKAAKSDREKRTLELLAKFQAKMEKAKEIEIPVEEEETEESWLKHSLKCEDAVPVLAKDASVKTAETYDISDPRNPINKRRRGEDDSKSGRSKRRRD